MLPFARSPSNSGHETCTPTCLSANQPLFWQARVDAVSPQSANEASPRRVGKAPLPGSAR
jgi:hypothetical protein